HCRVEKLQQISPSLNSPFEAISKSVTEKVEAWRTAWKSRVDDVDPVEGQIVLEARLRFLAAAAAQEKKRHEGCSRAAHCFAPAEWSRLHAGLAHARFRVLAWCPRFLAGIHVFWAARSKTWIATQLGLARVAQY